MSRKGYKMEEYIIFEGMKKTIISEIEKIGVIDEESSKKCFAYLERHRELLGDEETIEVIMSDFSLPEKSKAFIIPGGNYYVRLKKVTILFVAIILNLKISKNISWSTIGLSEKFLNAFINLSEETGEKCIVKELACKKKVCDSAQILDNGGECINNHFNCPYNEEGACRLTNEKILELCEGLAEKEVFDKVGNYFVYKI